MEFDNHKSIYLQLVDLLSEHILAGKWPPGDKIPSVRDLGSLVQVNPNTVLRAYDYIQHKGIVFNKRGIGYFVENDAIDRILELRRDEFYETTLPQLFKTMTLLRVTPDDVISKYNHYRSETAKKKATGNLVTPPSQPTL